MQLMRDSLDKNLHAKPPKSNLKPEFFSGNSNEVAGEWLDFYERIARVEKYFTRSLYSLVINFSTIEEKFRIPARPCNILYLLQQLGARKQPSNEPLDSYVADITRYYKRLNLSYEDSMRYLIDGLQSDLQTYVSLQPLKTFQEAEILASRCCLNWRSS